MGAPFTYKTTSIIRLGLLARDDGGESGFVADDPDLLVVDPDVRNYRPQIGFSPLDIGRVDFLADEGGEGFNPLGGNRGA
ncbi:hypothetical protein [Rhodoblastus sp.]|uniref:hypothetical protein n=1 Tax=Rhodoblastus sp. TaxID=1962975 RepID=UPI003F9B950D